MEEDQGRIRAEFSVSGVCSWMNVGQNGDPDDCVRFGYLWGLNGGEVWLFLGGVTRLGGGGVTLYSVFFFLFSDGVNRRSC